MTYTNVFTDKYNAVTGAIVAVLTAIFGTYWYVFAAFLALNVIDWITGWIKANKKKEESSKVGAIGAVKKLGYWAVVLVAFLIASVFVHFGKDMLGIDLSFLHLIGWWVLAMLIVNEVLTASPTTSNCICSFPSVPAVIGPPTLIPIPRTKFVPFVAFMYSTASMQLNAK